MALLFILYGDIQRLTGQFDVGYLSILCIDYVQCDRKLFYLKNAQST
jgi:hypothetical protein